AAVGGSPVAALRFGACGTARATLPRHPPAVPRETRSRARPEPPRSVEVTMSRRASLFSLGLVLGVSALTATACWSDAQQPAGPLPPWMVSFDESPNQPIGVDEDVVHRFIFETLKSRWATEKANKTSQDNFKTAWEKNFLLQTPAHKEQV